MIMRLMNLIICVAVFSIAPQPAVCQELDASTDSAQRHLIVVVGAPGTAEYGKLFKEWALLWDSAGRQAEMTVTVIGDDATEVGSRESLKHELEKLSGVAGELWIVLIGHGTFDGQQAKFNLVGDDVTATEFNDWLKSRKGESIVINCASSSGPWASILTGQNRIVVTATNNGYEMNFAHFGKYLAETISANDVDLDKDKQTSLLEAVITANGKTAEFYKADSRLATEHALIEDNSDGRGTPVSWFRGTRTVRVARDGTPSDGMRCNQVFLILNENGTKLTTEQGQLRRDLELQIENLRLQKTKMSEDQYYRRLEVFMLSLSRLYRDAEAANSSGKSE